MKEIKVAYKENWDCEGYHTTQTIKMSKELLDGFNKFLDDCRKPIEAKRIKTSEEMNLIMYGKQVDNLERCLRLTQLRLLVQYLKDNGISCNRVKTDRNTMLVVL